MRAETAGVIDGAAGDDKTHPSTVPVGAAVPRQTVRGGGIENPPPRADGYRASIGSRMSLTEGSVRKNSCTAGSWNAWTSFLTLSVSA